MTAMKRSHIKITKDPYQNVQTAEMRRICKTSFTLIVHVHQPLFSLSKELEFYIRGCEVITQRQRLLRKLEGLRRAL